MSNNKVEWSNGEFPKWIQNNAILNVAATCWNCHPEFQSSLIVGGHYEEDKPFSPKMCREGIHLDKDKGYVNCSSPETKVNNPSEMVINTHDSDLNDGATISTKDNVKTVTFHPHLSDAPTLVKHYFTQHTSRNKDNDGLCHNQKDQIDILNMDDKHPHPYHYCSQFTLHQDDKVKNVVLCSKKQFNEPLDSKLVFSVKKDIENHQGGSVCDSKKAKSKCRKMLKTIQDQIAMVECPSCSAISQFTGDNHDEQYHRELLYTGDGKLKCMIVDKKGTKTPWPTFKKKMIAHYQELLKNSDTHDQAAEYIQHFDSLEYLNKGNLTKVSHSLPKKIDTN